MNSLDVIREDGVDYLRISSVLHCFRFPDDYESADVGRMHEAARVGKQVHGRIEKISKGLKVSPPKSFEALTAWENWLDWKEFTGWKPGGIVEQRYFDRELGITGCVDTADSGGVIDWKSSARLLTRHWIQANAYVALIWPEDEREGKIVRLVRVDKAQRLWDDKSQSFDSELWEWTVELVKMVKRMYGEAHYTLTS